MMIPVEDVRVSDCHCQPWHCCNGPSATRGRWRGPGGQMGSGSRFAAPSPGYFLGAGGGEDTTHRLWDLL